ncbi:Gamma-butyrobetaine dioxygenase [Holothuria leucospilota]|uniref:Gamma-butyrobetaine dioxygenase n=1 Tax=Holothuria leucospilota TaxID=206669 RepID=A0A9Q1H9F7_HOLLE|nr:Gamma-butyrobetaine dioxygenase [Holothuria leucospilota]
MCLHTDKDGTPDKVTDTLVTSSFSETGSSQSVMYTSTNSDVVQAAKAPCSEIPLHFSAHYKDYAYLPSWRKAPENKLISLVDQKDYLEVVYERSSSEGSSPSHQVCHYSYDWLRDICRCDECFNTVTHNKQTAISLHPQRPKSIGISEDGDFVEISWDGGHDSRYPKSVLLAEYLLAKDPRENDPVIDAQRQLWGSDLPESSFRKYEFDSLITDDHSLFDWLMDLRKTGLTVVKNAPRKLGQVTELCNRVAYPRIICWGPTFQVGVKENASHVAYSNLPLSMHTDSAFYMFPPGVQVLHCIKQASSGGQTHVADGFRAAEKIRQADPECFDLLTKTEWEYFDMGDDYIGPHHLQARHPVIRLDSRGRLRQIVYNDLNRGWRQDNATSTSPAAYKALRKYSEYLNAEDSMLKYTLKEGDIIVIDNFRVLHGRSKVDSASARLMEGAFMDWDEICSKLRSLGKALFS